MTAQGERHYSGVNITNREIYDQVIATKELAAKLVDKVEAIEKRDGDHETRIRSLERKVWIALGGGSALGGAAGALVTFLTSGGA